MDDHVGSHFGSPLVLTPITLCDLIEFVAKLHASPTILVICSNKQNFLNQVQESSQRLEVIPSDDNQRWSSRLSGANSSTTEPHDVFLAPSLRLISAARTVKTAFCSSLPALQAYLTGLPAAYEAPRPSECSGEREKCPMLCLINSATLLKESASWSAQKYGKFIACAVESANRGRQRLIIAECSLSKNHWQPFDDGKQEKDSSMSHTNSTQDEECEARDIEFGLTESVPTTQTANVWEEAIPILNSTTKTYGLAVTGDWLGQTVKVAKVVQVWCSTR